MDISRTLNAGFRTIEHAESIVWHGLADDTEPAGMQRLAEQIAQSGVAVTPTLAVHANLARIVETRGAHLEREEMAAFNPVIARFQRGDYERWAAQETSDRPRMQAAYERFTGLLHDAGVPLVLGSDSGVMATPHGVSAIRELQLLVRSGLTPAEALRTGTLNAAAVLDLPAGRIAPGLLADLVLLDADPREDFGILRRPAGVMTNGIWYDGEALAALREASRRPKEWSTQTRMLRHLLTR